MIFAGNLLGRYCGNTLPDAVDTSDSFAYVKFVTDGSVNARGFRLRFDSSTEGWICRVQIYSQGATYTTDHSQKYLSFATMRGLYLMASKPVGHPGSEAWDEPFREGNINS